MINILKFKNSFFILAFTVIFSLGSSYAEEQTRESVEVSDSVIEKNVPAYKMSLTRLIEEAEKNLQRVDAQIKNQEKEKLARELLEEGNSLYKTGDLENAQKKWKEALKITKDPSFKKYIKESEKQALKEKEEKDRARKLEEKAKKKASYEAKLEAKKQAHLEAKKKKLESKKK